MNALVLSVLIPVLNAEKTLEKTLSSLLGQQVPRGYRVEILVVDNGSTDQSLAIARRQAVRILHCATRGCGAVRNEGLRHVQGEVIVLIDADARPARPDFLQEVVETFQRYPEAGVVGGPILPDPTDATAVGVAEHMVAFLHWHHRRPEGVARIFQPGANLSLRREAAQEMGEFRLDLPNLEDMEWQDRLLARGRWKIVFNPRVVVYHATRRRIGNAMRHIYRYGYGHRAIYMELRPSARWPFRDDPDLFPLNLPRFILRRFRLVLGQWLRADPRRCAPLIPWILFFSSVWAWGVVVGGRRYLKRHPTTGKGGCSA